MYTEVDCYFPFLEFLLLKEDTKNILPLQILSAEALTRSRDVFEKYINEIPPNMFPFLLQTTIQHSYSKLLLGEVNWLRADSIVSLMEFWPYEVLTLREHLVGKYITMKPYKFTSLSQVKVKFFEFLQQLVEYMVHGFIFRRMTRTFKRTRIQRLDVSCVGATVEKILYRYYSEASTNENFEKGWKLRLCELVCDIFLNDLNISEFVTLLSQDENRRNSSRLTIIFDKIVIESVTYIQATEILNFAERSVSPNYVEFNMCDLTSFTSNSLNAFCKTLNGLRLSYCFPGIVANYEFGFLSRLSNLHQLDLSGIRSRDGWGILAELPRGLTYLKMAGCPLLPRDLEGLARHSRSLLQIDLSHESMHSQDKFTALSTLLCNLEKVEIIELQDCRLGDASEDMLVSFLQRFVKSCPRVKVLQLRGNDFSTRFIREHLVLLAKKESLRIFSLTVPSDVYLSDDYREVSQALTNLKMMVMEKVNTLASTHNSQLRVEWNENADFSRWYYFV